MSYGTEDAPYEWELKLYDAFLGNCDKLSIEAVVKGINVNNDKGAELLNKCITLQIAHKKGWRAETIMIGWMKNI